MKENIKNQKRKLKNLIKKISKRENLIEDFFNKIRFYILENEKIFIKFLNLKRGLRELPNKYHFVLQNEYLAEYYICLRYAT